MQAVKKLEKDLYKVSDWDSKIVNNNQSIIFF
jgi:hypothetical protein